MRLPNVDVILDDIGPIPEAHAHYLAWITANLGQNRAENSHMSPFPTGRATVHACECDYLIAYQNGSALALQRLRERLPEVMHKLYGQSIELPEVFVFVGEARNGFSVLERNGCHAVKIDFRTAMTLTLTQFLLGVSGGNPQLRQLATWLILSVVLSKNRVFDPVLMQLAHEARAMDQRVFEDLVGSVANLILLHEIGHVLFDQLPKGFAQVVYQFVDIPGADQGQRIGAASAAIGAPPTERTQPVDAHARLILPPELARWNPEITADCFSVFGHFACLLEVYNGQPRIAIEAICDSFLGWNLTFFGLWSMQQVQSEAMGLGPGTTPETASHPDGLTRCDIMLFYINHIMARVVPDYRSPALGRSVRAYQNLWSADMHQSLRALRTYLLVTPEAFETFRDGLLRTVLSGCLYDEFKQVGSAQRLTNNLREIEGKWTAFHTANHLNGQPVFLDLAQQFGALDLKFISEDRV